MAGINYFNFPNKEQKLVLIAGPCVIEPNRDILYQTADELLRITNKLGIPFIFKSSFDKANRSSIESYRGPGIQEGLRALEYIKNQFQIPILTDIHIPEQAKQVSAVVDYIQIPAFLCRQTDLLIAAGETGKPVNVKKGQYLAPEGVINIIKKIESTGNKQIIITERGTSFGYNRLVNDMTAIPIMQGFGYPVIFDATHSVQMPGSGGDYTGGLRWLAPYLARAAVAVGVDGIFMEVHPDPGKASCDGGNMLALKDVEGLVGRLIRVRDAVKV